LLSVWLDVAATTSTASCTVSCAKKYDGDKRIKLNHSAVAFEKLGDVYTAQERNKSGLVAILIWMDEVSILEGLRELRVVINGLVHCHEGEHQGQGPYSHRLETPETSWFCVNLCFQTPCAGNHEIHKDLKCDCEAEAPKGQQLFRVHHIMDHFDQVVDPFG
jgi:hypothetical protein